MNDEPLLPEEAARLSRARVPIAPPPDEEERLVSALRQRGLLCPPRWRALWKQVRSLFTARILR